MFEFLNVGNHGLDDEQKRLIDNFCESEKPASTQEQAIVDQAAAELRDQLAGMGLIIETEEQFHIACVVAIATSVNMRKLVDSGIPAVTAEDVSAKTIAAIRPTL